MSLPTPERVLRLSGRVSAFLNCEEPCVTEAIEVAPGELDLATFFGVRRPPSFRCADRFDEAYRTRCAATGTGLTPEERGAFSYRPVAGRLRHSSGPMPPTKSTIRFSATSCCICMPTSSHASTETPTQVDRLAGTRATRLSDRERVSRADRSYPRCTQATLAWFATRRTTVA